MKNFLVFLVLSLASCANQDQGASNFRIVGLNGETKPIQTRVPELNARILESQGRNPQQFANMQQSSINQEQQIPQQQNQAQQIPQTNNSNQITANKQFIASANADFGNVSNAEQLQSAPSYNLPKSDIADAQNIAKNISDKKSENSTTSVGEVANKDQEIEYDLSDAATNKKTKNKMKLKSSKANSVALIKDDEANNLPTKKTKNGKTIFIQTGSFANEENANQTLIKMQKFYQGKIEQSDKDGKIIYRVLLGPFAGEKTAKATLNKIKSSGHDAIIVKNK
ncbi:MAG: SPOR domain-containing protein [Rickettsiales bacterium]|nr:SPOR domain-containing protein [Rickettsiales bacterium]